MNETFKIIENTDETVICDENGYSYIRFTNPNNEHDDKIMEIIDFLLQNIDLKEML